MATVKQLLRDNASLIQNLKSAVTRAEAAEARLQSANRFIKSLKEAKEVVAFERNLLRASERKHRETILELMAQVKELKAELAARPWWKRLLGIK